MLQRLARASGDSEIKMAVLDPKPIEEFYDRFGYFNWVRLPDTLTADEFRDVMNAGHDEFPAWCVETVGEAVVWVPPSVRRAIFDDRKSDLVVFAEADGENFRPGDEWRAVHDFFVRFAPALVQWPLRELLLTSDEILHYRRERAASANESPAWPGPSSSSPAKRV